MYPTFEQCRTIVAQSTIFKESHLPGDTFDCYKFSYMHQTEEIATLNGEELRGITFVFDRINNTHKVFPMLHKFYNVGQIPEVELEVLKQKTIKTISTKLDGSLIGFYQLPDGSLHPMTNGSFENKVVDQVKKFSRFKEIKAFVAELFQRNYFPLFEWVSPNNKIVLHYPEDDLKLLQIRDINGDYLDLEQFDDLIKKYGIQQTITWQKEDLDTLMKKREELTAFEGWVIRFTDNAMVKLKTEEYFELHRKSSNVTIRSIFELIINDQLDDYKELLSEQGNMMISLKKGYVLACEKVLKKYITDTMRSLKQIVEDDQTGSVKEFALKYKGDPFFSILMKVKRDPTIDPYRSLKETLLRRYKTLESIEIFLEELLKDDPGGTP